MKTIKEIYDTKSIDDKGDLIGLQKWYNSVIEKTPEELDFKDVSIMLRQRFFVEIAVEKAIGYLKANPFIGEMYQGQLMVNLLYYHEKYGFDYSITLSYIENNPDRIDVAGAFIYQIEKDIERLNHTDRYNKYGCFNSRYDELFWKIFEELIDLERNGEIVSDPDKKPISYLRDLLQNDGPEWSYTIEFWPKGDPVNKYKIGVCVRGAPIIQRL